MILILTLLRLALFSRSHSESKNSPNENSENNPLVGAWLLIYGKYYTPDRDSLIGEINSPDQPSSIKVFSNGHFAYIPRGEDGLNTAGSGSYRIEGN